jgi:hypothetical protein
VGPDAAWDAWVDAAGAEGDYLQTSWWAEIDRRANGREPIVVRYGGAGALVTHGADTMRCLHGPVLVGGTDGLPALLDAVESAGRDVGARAVIFVGRPPRSEVPARLLAAAFGERGYVETPWRTAVVDLARDDDALLASFDRAVPKAIRRCRAGGVEVLVCDGATFETRFLPAFASATPGYDLARDRIAFELDGGRHHTYRIAVDADDVVLATLGTYRYGGIASEVMSSRTAAGVASRLPAQDLLHWEAMREHRDRGDRWFDLAGFAAAPSSEKEEGIKRFKLKWNGEEVDSPVFSLTLERPWRRVARRARRLARV